MVNYQRYLRERKINELSDKSIPEHVQIDKKIVEILEIFNQMPDIDDRNSRSYKAKMTVREALQILRGPNFTFHSY